MQQFGPHLIRGSEIFYRSALCTAFVNLKPIVPGHVLVVPQRVVRRFTELTVDEVQDLFISAQKIGRVVEKVFGGTSLTVAIQDGPDAGQSVPHVHVHVMPRKPGDFPRNDDIYVEMNQWNGQPHSLDNDNRAPRSLEEMAAEAEILRRTLAELELQLELRGKALKEAKEKILNQLSKLQREEVALEEKIREQSANVNI